MLSPPRPSKQIEVVSKKTRPRLENKSLTEEKMDTSSIKVEKKERLPQRNVFGYRLQQNPQPFFYSSYSHSLPYCRHYEMRRMNGSNCNGGQECPVRIRSFYFDNLTQAYCQGVEKKKMVMSRLWFYQTRPSISYASFLHSFVAATPCRNAFFQGFVFAGPRSW